MVMLVWQNKLTMFGGPLPLFPLFQLAETKVIACHLDFYGFAVTTEVVLRAV